MSRGRRALLVVVYAVLIAGLGLSMLNAGCRSALRVEPLHHAEHAPVVDEHLELARRHAPLVLHETDPARGRQDIPTRVDFDGDLVGDDDWEDFPFWSLAPTVYYAVAETETHWFLTYHLFHPRDWTPLRLGLHGTHENDGENLQVVVRKATDAVELLYAQAHYEGRSYGPGDAGRDGPLVLVDGRAAVFVEAQGHGIYGAGDADARVTMGDDGGADFDRHGLVYRPAAPGEDVSEPALDAAAPVPYALESTAAKLWPGVRDGSLVGSGGLFDGVVPYADERVDLLLPRYYEANRLSGPFGPDRGISPFAVDFGFEPPHLGALLFDPARRWAEVVEVPAPWATDLLAGPFEPAR